MNCRSGIDANKTFIQEIDATSSTNIIQHAFIKILNSRSGYKSYMTKVYMS